MITKSKSARTGSKSSGHLEAKRSNSSTQSGGGYTALATFHPLDGDPEFATARIVLLVSSVGENSPVPMSTPCAHIKLSTTLEGIPLPPLVRVQGSDSEREDGVTLFRRMRAPARELFFKGARDSLQQENPVGADLSHSEEPVAGGIPRHESRAGADPPQLKKLVASEPLQQEVPTTATLAAVLVQKAVLADDMWGEPRRDPKPQKKKGEHGFESPDLQQPKRKLKSEGS